MPNMNEINKKMKELRNSIDIFKQNVADIINKLNNVADNFEIYYKINESIINNYPKKERNFELLKNINENNNCDIFIKSLKEINDEKILINKLSKICVIYEKMNSKEEINNEQLAKYNTNENDSKEKYTQILKLFMKL